MYHEDSMLKRFLWQMFSMSCAIAYDTLLCSNDVKFCSRSERLCNKIMFCEPWKTECNLIIYRHAVLSAELCCVRAPFME